MLTFQFQYRPLIDLTVKHEFLDGGNLKRLKIEPDTNTANALRSLGLLFKSTDSGFKIFSDEVASSSLLFKLEQLERLELGFWLSYGTPYFRNITEGASLDLNEIFYFSTPSTKTCFLHNDTYASAGDIIKIVNSLEELDNDVEIETLSGEPLSNLNPMNGVLKIKKKGKEEIIAIPPRRGLKYPTAFIRITWDKKQIQELVTELKSGETPTENYVIQFQNRKAVWKYIFMSRYAENVDKLKIKSVSDKINFSGPNKEPEKLDRVEVSFSTKEALTISELSSYNFQLTQKSDKSGEKIVVKRLPVPRVDSIIKDNSSNQLLACIYVNL